MQEFKEYASTHGLIRSVHVSQEGEITYSFFAEAHFLGKVGFEKGKVPEDVVAKGAEAIEAYLNDVIKDMARRDAELRAAYKQRRESICVSLSINHDGQELRGILTSSAHKGLAYFDVRLTSPQKYEGVETIYRDKYPTGDRVIANADGFPTSVAIEEATQLLTKIYDRRRHEVTHAKAYALVSKVTSLLKRK